MSRAALAEAVSGTCWLMAWFPPSRLQSGAARRWHGIAVAPQQLFHRPDAAVVAAGPAIDLGVLAGDVPAAAAFAFAAAVALPERDELSAARPGIGAERLPTCALCDRSGRGGRQHQGEDREDRAVHGLPHRPARHRTPRLRASRVVGSVPILMRHRQAAPAWPGPSQLS